MSKRLLMAKPIANELEKFNKSYKDSVFCENPRIQSIVEYVMKSDGKRVRPILLLLAAKACGEINEVAYHSAITVELLHTASLIHDDVVDESKIRRGKASVNAIYDNKMAVLVGDFFLSSALIKSVLTGNIDIISSISTLGRSLAEGELNQLSLVKESIVSEEEYFEVIKKKTASLLSICMKVGAISAGADEERTKQFTLLGEYLGICFQLKDDIFDYFSTDIGKPTGNDIREGKITLPLLFALKNADSEGSHKAIIEANDLTEENIELLISFAKENGGIEYAYAKIEEYKEKASVLISSLTDGEIKDALDVALEYVIERAY